MIDHFSIFTKGGVVLWSYNQAKLKGSPIDHLIRTILLEERGGETSHNVEQYTLKWTLDNEFDLVFVVVFQKILQLLYVEELLELVRRKFIESYKEPLQIVKTRARTQEFPFDELFTKILNALESRAVKEKKERTEKGPRTFYETEKAKKIKKEKKEDIKKKDEEEEEEEEAEAGTAEVATGSTTSNNNESSVPPADESDVDRKIRENIERLKLKKTKSPVKKSKPPTPSSPKTNSRITQRTWDGKASKTDIEELDYSKKFATSPSTSSKNIDEQFKPGKIDLDDWSDDEPEDDIDLSTPNAPKDGKFMSFLKGISGNKPLEASDLEPVLADLRQHLVSKNVAAEIAEKLCESVSVSLQGKKLGSFTTVKTTVKTALEEALIRILTPKRNIDILRDVIDANKEGRPYTVAFCGVNGVGKSTNLAKVCSYLQQHGHSVMLAACDTFRSGAVEQLGIHAKRLQVEIFEKGYRSEPTAIALEAVKYAKQRDCDVVLIDTAGRMQDNEPLMKALSKLINTVKPDLVLFVGEALVGNDAVDQLTKFNQALLDLSTEKEPRLIDGIILSKFDTIDDKVGAAISMVYTTGSPIVFLGVGQTYSDLKRMNVHVITKALLKGA